MSAVYLVLLAMLDGSLSGFRAAAGRNGRIEKQRYYMQAVWRGLMGGLVVAAIGVCIALLLVALRGPELWAKFLLAGDASVQVFAVFAFLVMSGLLLWIAPSRDVRTLTTVTVLGPGTFIRPYLIWIGLGVGFYASPGLEVGIVMIYGAAAMLWLEGFLHRRYYAVRQTLVLEGETLPELPLA